MSDNWSKICYEGGFLPPYDLVPLIHATWVDTQPNLPEYRKNNRNMACSNCKRFAGRYKHRTYRYCPWCGAKMDAIALDKNHAFEARVDGCDEQ